MFVTSINMGLGSHKVDSVKVVDVNVDENTEKTREDLLANLLEVPGKWSSNIGRKDVFIVDLGFNPVHEETHILWRGQCGGLPVFILILPSVLIPRST